MSENRKVQYVIFSLFYSTGSRVLLSVPGEKVVPHKSSGYFTSNKGHQRVILIDVNMTQFRLFRLFYCCYFDSLSCSIDNYSCISSSHVMDEEKMWVIFQSSDSIKLFARSNIDRVCSQRMFSSLHSCVRCYLSGDFFLPFLMPQCNTFLFKQLSTVGFDGIGFISIV